jgi:hypothetical protein
VSIMPRIVIIEMLFLSVVVGVHVAAAQDSRLYAGVSGMWSTQASMTLPVDPDAGIPETGVGGTAFGVVGEFGTLLTPKVKKWTFSVAFEFSVPAARFDSAQFTDSYIHCICATDNQHRDLVFSGLLHLHAAPHGPVRLGFVVGPSIIQEDTLQRTAFENVSPSGMYLPGLGPFGSQTQLTRWTVGLTVGADVGIQVSRRVQIVPQIRLHLVNRAEPLVDYGASANLGLSSWLIRPAVGIRASF